MERNKMKKEDATSTIALRISNQLELIKQKKLKRNVMENDAMQNYGEK